MYSDMEAWEDKVETGFSKQVWDFVTKASQTALAAGKHIGPVPDWLPSMPGGSKNGNPAAPLQEETRE